MSTYSSTAMSRSRVINLANLDQFAAINVLSDPGAIAGPKTVPSCAQIVLAWNLPDGKIGHNVLYGRYSGTFAGSVAQANAIMTALSSGAQWTALASHLAVNTQFAAVTLRDVSTPDNPIISSTNAAVPGTGAGTLMPDEVAICVTLRTAKTGPQNRGRMYLPGFDSASVGGGNVIATAVMTAVTNWAGTITGAMSGSGYTFVIGQPARAAYTGTTGRQHPARTATSTPVTSTVVRDNHWDSQRRRGLR